MNLTEGRTRGFTRLQVDVFKILAILEFYKDLTKVFQTHAPTT